MGGGFLYSLLPSGSRVSLEPVSSISEIGVCNGPFRKLISRAIP